MPLSEDKALADSREMAESFNSPETAYYFERFGFCPKQIGDSPNRDLGTVVVIPAYNEANLLEALNALSGAAKPSGSIEIIVVINSKEGELEEILGCNAKAYKEACEFARAAGGRAFHIHVLLCTNLPHKKTGVGLARKIGMDEALRRFDQVKRPEGVIVCFDADCTCDADYLVKLESWFSDRERIGCSIYFEHPLEGSESPEVYEAITLYELHLRYYVEGLRYAGFPYAFHTIGSSMAVRADVYRKQGGMNKRQAGEDFYFLHKVIPLGGFGDLTGTRVIASPRASNRVPFGTGRAVGEFLQGKELLTYNHQSFFDLKALFENVEKMYSTRAVGVVPEALETFLKQEGFDPALEEMLQNSSGLVAFKKRFFDWFDAFQTMKFLHHARDYYYANKTVAQEAASLLPLISGGTLLIEKSAGELLVFYRKWQRENPRYFRSLALSDSFCKTTLKP
jgi:glycosyltransferase involved in cell wall biosynthesis